MTLLLALYILILPFERTSLATGITATNKEQHRKIQEAWRRQSTIGNSTHPFPLPRQLDFQSNKIEEDRKTFSTPLSQPYKASRNSQLNRRKTAKVAPHNLKPPNEADTSHQIGGRKEAHPPTENRVYFITHSEVCPKNKNCLTITQESRKHSGQHFIENKINHFNEVMRIARQKTATSILAKEDFQFSQLIDKLNDPSTRIRSRKEGSNYVHDLEIKIQNWNKTTSKEYRFRIVTCGTSVCNNVIPSKGYISRGGFKNGDVITIYPLCGPKVLKVPRAQDFVDYIHNGGVTSQFPLPAIGLDYVPCL